jgi:hypothetical protein
MQELSKKIKEEPLNEQDSGSSSGSDSEPSDDNLENDELIKLMPKNKKKILPLKRKRN